MASRSESEGLHGLIAWMTTNAVTPNLLMIALLLGGVLMALRIKQEVFPEFSEDMVTVTVPYPGASPEEVEQGIVLAVEEAVRGLDGVKEITAVAREGAGVVRAELIEGVDQQGVYQDIKQEIDRITTFPEDAEEPRVVLEKHARFVLRVIVHGDVGEVVLRELTEQVRDRLLQEPGVTQVNLHPTRTVEVAVAVPFETLRAYNLTLDDIAARINRAAVELPGGSVKTSAGEILLRMTDRRDYASEFGEIPIITTPDGTQLVLSDIATVRDDFEETDRTSVYNGQRSLTLEVYRIGAQTPIGVSDAVHAALPTIEVDLPPGIELAVVNDYSDIYRQRLQMLLRNGFIGLVLVFFILGLFLEARLAFWVMMGIPISFAGVFLFLPLMGVSINMISMFAFIIALGIVVDDAIVAGENIYEYRQRGMGFLEAAIRGARDVSIPIAFAVLTNVVAFLPLAFIPGIMGKIFGVIPMVVGTVFLISWVESLIILPAHLAHAKEAHGGWLHRRQQAFSRGFARFVEKAYGPLIDRCLRLRYLTVAIGLGVLTLVLGYVFSGRMGMVLMPRVESDQAVVTAVLPYGSPLAQVEAVRDRLLASANEVVAEHGGETLAIGTLATIDQSDVTVRIYLTDPDIRPIGTGVVTQLWREATGSILGLESLKFEADRGGPGSGASLTVELAHRDVPVLQKACSQLADALAQFDRVKDIDDGYTPGKRQLDFEMLPEGRSSGLSARDVARQLRSSFYGAEALRQQRGRNEVRVMVRLPESQRVSEYDVEELIVRTPAGTDVPLRQVAKVTRGRAYTSINRREGRRTMTVTADVEPRDQTEQVVAGLKQDALPELVRAYPGLTYSFEGRQADMRESLGSLVTGFVLAVLGIYVLLAIPFGSYIQPVIVMASIPFGIVGAVIGHMIMGYSLSIISLMGIIALAGVVVNDALVLIIYANKLRTQGAGASEAVRLAGIRRFRPIILTTVTTFGGLAPMIFETSRQARFLIPMALSLGFGIVFATGITLLIVPSLYVIVEDVKHAFARLVHLSDAEPAIRNSAATSEPAVGD